MRRFGLTRTFALVSLLAMVALGLALVVASSTLLRRQAVAEGTRTAQAYALLALEQEAGLKAAVLQTQGGASEVQSLSEKLGQRLGLAPGSPVMRDSNLLSVRVWNRDGKLVYDSTPPSSDPDAEAVAGFYDPARFDRAITDGVTAPAVARRLVGPDFGAAEQPVIEVYVPLFFGGQKARSGRGGDPGLCRHRGGRQ